MFIGHLTVRGIIHYMTQGKGGDREMKEQLLFSQGAVLTSTRRAWLPSKTLYCLVNISGNAVWLQIA